LIGRLNGRLPDFPITRLLDSWSFVMKPLFEANHRWAMAQFEQEIRRSGGFSSGRKFS
jgi:hypothetical protein